MALGFEDEFTTFLHDYILGQKVADAIGKKSPGLALFMSTGDTRTDNGKATPRTYGQMITGGTKVKRHVRYARGTAKGSYSGWDILETDPNRKYDAAEFEWYKYYTTLPWSRDDLLAYQGQSSEVDKMTADVEGQVADMIDMLATGIYNNAAARTGYQLKGLYGLRELFAGDIDWGGISQSDHTWWLPKIDSTGYTAANQVDPTHANYLPTLIDDRRRAIFAYAGIDPEIILTTGTLYDRLHDIIQATQQNVNVTKGIYGFDAIKWRGMEVYKDAYCPAGHMMFLTPRGNGSQRSMALLGRAGAFFELGPWIQSFNQEGQVRRLLCHCSFYCDNPREQAALTGLAE